MNIDFEIALMLGGLCVTTILCIVALVHTDIEQDKC